MADNEGRAGGLFLVEASYSKYGPLFLRDETDSIHNSIKIQLITTETTYCNISLIPGLKRGSSATSLL